MYVCTYKHGNVTTGIVLVSDNYSYWSQTVQGGNIDHDFVTLIVSIYMESCMYVINTALPFLQMFAKFPVILRVSLTVCYAASAKF